MMQMFVAGMILDAGNGCPILVLTDSQKQRALPIWIGTLECNAISFALGKISPERPLSHDLMLKLIEQLGFKVECVEVNELSSSTYFATIKLVAKDKSQGVEPLAKAVDARPSDAIALALRAKAPIFVSPQVVAQGTIPTDLEREKFETDEFKKFIQNLKASDFNALSSDGK